MQAPSSRFLLSHRTIRSYLSLLRDRPLLVTARLIWNQSMRSSIPRPPSLPPRDDDAELLRIDPGVLRMIDTGQVRMRPLIIPDYLATSLTEFLWSAYDLGPILPEFRSELSAARPPIEAGNAVELENL